MLGKLAKMEIPRLLANLPFRRIAVLVQGLEIAEHACELFPGDAQFFSIHGLLPLSRDF
jgi:hypothetical protein